MWFVYANSHSLIIDILDCGTSPLNDQLKELIKMVRERAGPSLAGALESIDLDHVPPDFTSAFQLACSSAADSTSNTSWLLNDVRDLK